MRHRNPSDNELANVLHSLGPDQSGHISNVTGKEKLVEGMQLLIEYHFGNYAEAERADIVGELMFNGKLFRKETSNQVAAKVTRSATSAIFLSVRHLRTSDFHT